MCHDNISSWACDPSVLRATAQTHKKVEENWHPKPHPIVGAARQLTTPLGENLSEIIDPVAKAKSTEEVLRMIENTNHRLEKEGIKDILNW